MEFSQETKQKEKWRQRRLLRLGHRIGESLCYSGASLSLSSTLFSKWVFEIRHLLRHHHQVKMIFFSKVVFYQSPIFPVSKFSTTFLLYSEISMMC